MKHIFKTIADQLEQNKKICLATILATRGSAPQVAGSSAVFSEDGLLDGTLGGGVMEGDAQMRAAESIKNRKHQLYNYNLDAEIDDPEGALCGGSATILLDHDPAKHLACFREMKESLKHGLPGIMITVVNQQHEVAISRFWQKNIHLEPKAIPGQWPEMQQAYDTAIKKGKCTLLENSSGELACIEPINPESQLIIAGAGHIGKALTHMAHLLDFEVTVIDDRAEHANPENIPDADHIIVDDIGKAMAGITKTNNTFIVIVTRGHRDDAMALKACINNDVPYIGMIGSRRKIRQVRQKFMDEGWSTPTAFNRVHAPIGLEIGSVSVQEIALSISAQLVQARATARRGRKREIITSVILAAGESRRMGQPKMLLPYGNSNIIGTVTSNALHAISDHVRVVLGAGAEDIGASIASLSAERKINREYKKGMLSSVQAGIQDLPMGTTAIMILLGDQPAIGSEIMDRLIDRYKQSDKEILIASANGKRGHPMIFSTRYIPEILAFGENQSLRDLIAKHPEEVEEVETGKAEILRDIDTPEDYETETLNKQ